MAGARTPTGKFGGRLSSFKATELGSIAIAEALRRCDVEASRVDYVFMGHVLQAGQGQATARQAAVGAGIPMSVPATTINKVCLSGLNAIYLAHLMVSSGEADIVVAGGMESMSNAPFVLPDARWGMKAGHSTVLDSIFADGLTCAFDHCSMGESADGDSSLLGISRLRQDEFAAASHQKATLAQQAGYFAEEIVPVTVATSPVDKAQVDADEGIRADSTSTTLGRLKPAFSAAGTITAGNASQISDGACAVVIASDQLAQRMRLAPLGRVVSYAQVAGPGTSLLKQPSQATFAALKKAGLSLSELDVIEINEAFAAVALASIDELGVSQAIVNQDGGAIALGHPIGASGTRIALSLLMQLRRKQGRFGVAALCGGGGQGDALIVESMGA